MNGYFWLSTGVPSKVKAIAVCVQPLVERREYVIGFGGSPSGGDLFSSLNITAFNQVRIACVDFSRRLRQMYYS